MKSAPTFLTSSLFFVAISPAFCGQGFAGNKIIPGLRIPVPPSASAIQPESSLRAPAASLPLPKLAAPVGLLSAPAGEASPTASAEAGNAPALEAALPALFDGQAVHAETEDFLSRLGFKDYSAQIAASLKNPGLTEAQKKVLEFNGRRYQVFNAARGLAAEVMAGLTEQGYSPESMDKATELAARLLALQPLAPPASLPADIANKDKTAIQDWIIAVTVQKLSSHLVQVVSDVVGTIFPEKTRKAALEDLTQGRAGAPAAKELLARVEKIKPLAERLLVTAYTDAEMGQTRYAGRALAASLMRFARRHGRAEVEESLKTKVLQRGLQLENFVGDTLLAPSVSSSEGIARIQVQSGDFLGERSSEREAAEITFAVRPHPLLWWRAWRAKLLGHPIAMLTNWDEGPSVKPGRGLLNGLKIGLWKFLHWVSQAPILRRGYSHVGMVAVDKADGISMAWAVDNYPNAQEGGIRKIGILEEFAQQGPFLRLGVARLDADKVWQEYRRQASRGYRTKVYQSEDGRWPVTLSRKEFQALSSIPRDEAPRLLDELNGRAVQVLEMMLTRFGVGFAYGFTNKLWSAYCSSTMILSHLMGSQFEVQDKPDHWHLLVRLLKWLGVPGAKDQPTEGRIVWPGSLFIDPKIAEHASVYYPPYREVGRIQDPYTLPAYVEMDRKLSAGLLAYVRLSDGGSIAPDPDVIAAALRAHLDSRLDKQGRKRGIRGFRSGANPSTGYSAGFEDLIHGR